MRQRLDRVRKGKALTLQIALAAAAGLLVLALGSPRAPRPPASAPRPLREGREAEAKGGAELEAWQESRHRTPPGVSWRAVEIANQRANLTLRAALRRGHGPAPDGGHWRERGSINQTGRTLVTAPSPDGQTLVIGSDGGGVFSGRPGAASWQPRGDSIGASVYHLLASPGRPEVWLAADQFLRVLVSSNQGASWAPPKGLPEDLVYVYQMVHDGGDPRTIYLLASSWANGANDTVLCRSQDGGLTFSTVYRQPAAGVPDLWTSRIASGPLYLMAGGRLSISTNRGATFTPVGTAGAGDAAISVLRGSEAGAPTLYAVLGDQNYVWRLWASEDGGAHWEARYDFAKVFFAGTLGSMSASIQDPERLLFGGTNAYRSTDGGRTFTVVNNAGDYNQNPRQKLHADVNGIEFAMWQGREVVFFNTDGGTFLSADGGVSVENITQSGFADAEYYSTLTSKSNPDWIAVGSQDQGLQLSRPGSGALLSFDQITPADYGDLTSSSGDLRMLYAIYPGLIVLLPDAAHPDQIGGFALPPLTRRGFFPFILADPDDEKTLYVAGDHLFRMRQSLGYSFSYTQLAQDFTAEDGQDYVTGLAISPADHAHWYATTHEGFFWSSTDHGATWTRSPATAAHEEYFGGAFVLASPTDPDTCIAAGAGYRDDPVWKTTDGGTTWASISAGLPQTIVSALAFDDPRTQTLYAASDAGPFRLDSATGTWTSLLGTEAPLTRYTSVESVPAAGVMRFATFGRGIWDYTPPAKPGPHLRPIFLP